MITQRTIFSGQVQGVGFRWTTVQFARNLPMTGFVRNLDDGTVELITTAESGVLQTLIDRLTGHFGASITGIKIHERHSVEDYDDFQIRH